MDVPFKLELDAEALDPLPEKEALAAFRQAAHRDPGDPDYCFILGSALFQLGRHEEALAALREATRSLAGDTAYHRALGGVLLSLGRLAQAEDAFREALRQAPAEVGALNSLGVALLRQDRPREAADVLRRALASDRACAAAHSNLAVALWRSGDQAEAERSFREAARLRPDHAAFQRNLGLAQLALGRARDAHERFKALSERRPDDAETQMDVGDALFALRRHDEAEAAYDRALGFDPGIAGARPHSRENRQAILLQRVRAEVGAEREAPGGLAGMAAAGVSGVGELLKRGVAWRPALGRLPAVVAVVLIATLGNAAFALVPAYYSYYALEDEVAQAARAPIRDDRDVLDRVMHAVRERGLDHRIRAEDVRIETQARWRTIECQWDVPVRLFPGLGRSLRFRILVEEPYLSQPETLHF